MTDVGPSCFSSARGMLSSLHICLRAWRLSPHSDDSAGPKTIKSSR